MKKHKESVYKSVAGLISVCMFLGLIFSVPFLSPRTSSVPDPHVGTVIVNNICTGVVIEQTEKFLTDILTATHCLLGQDTAQIFSFDGTLLGDGQVVKTKYDIAVLILDAKKHLVSLDVSSVVPQRGNEIYGIGMVRASENLDIPVLMTGIYDGTRIVLDEDDTENAIVVYMVMLPSTPGFSGGPIYWQGKVIGIYSGSYRSRASAFYSVMSSVTTISLWKDFVANES